MADEPPAGMKLKAWRMSHGMSQADLGDLWGYGWHAICEWETGKKKIRNWVWLAMDGYDAKYRDGHRATDSEGVQDHSGAA